ncbi:MAG: sugar porter family MFS transporter [Actinomycetota bacterium]|nr:sugar porter family MFS transporter [Actinomycetota bacterium]
MISFVRELARPKNRYVAGIAVLAAIGGFLFGFDTGVVGSAEPFFAKALHIGSFGESWVVGSLLLGAICGAALAGWLAEAISRKWTKFGGGCLFVLAALGSAAAPNVELVCAARFVLGVAVGSASFVAPMYISEQSPKSLRGGMTALNQVMIAFGIFVAYLSDYGLSGIGAQNWRWMFAVEAIPGLALAIAMVIVPHTPRWLLERGREDEARAVLAKTRDRDEIDDEVGEIQDVVNAQRSTKLGELIGPRLRPMVLVGIILAFLQQAVGINAVIYFGASVLKFMGATTNTAVYEAISLGVVNFLGALVAALLLDWVGRRVLLIIGSAGMVTSLGALGWYFSTGHSFQHNEAWVGLVCVLGFLAFFEISLGPVFWLMIAELYPLGIRSKAMASATMVNWTANFLVSYFFLSLTKGIGKDGTFWLFGGFALLAVLYSMFRVPETKNRSLEEIEQELGAHEEGAANHVAA